MSKVTAKKLKLPIWQDIIYLICVAVAPIVITCLELFSSHSTVFKVTFSSIGALLITIMVIKRFVINNKIENIRKETFALEHDYSIAVGDEKLIKAKWKKCKLILYIYDATIVLISLLLATLFVTAITEGLIAFKGAILAILLSVFSGISFKIICYLTAIFEKEQNNEKT